MLGLLINAFMNQPHYIIIHREGTMEENVTINSESPDVLTNNMYTPAFLRQQIGKIVRVEFLIRNK